MKILQTWVSSRIWRPEPLYKVKSLTWKYWSLFSSLAKHCTILLTGETPNLGPKRYFPALRVWGGTTRPTKLGSKWSVEIMPEVLAAVETPKVESIYDMKFWVICVLNCLAYSFDSKTILFPCRNKYLHKLWLRADEEASSITDQLYQNCQGEHFIHPACLLGSSELEIWKK